MPHDPFPAAPGDAEDPDGSPLPPAAEGVARRGGQADWDEPEPPEQEFAQQGLYMSLPPEQLTLTGFAQGGEADTMAPGPLLATVLHVVTGDDGAGLAGLSDDQLMGIISAAQRIES